MEVAVSLVHDFADSIPGDITTLSNKVILTENKMHPCINNSISFTGGLSPWIKWMQLNNLGETQKVHALTVFVEPVIMVVQCFLFDPKQSKVVSKTYVYPFREQPGNNLIIEKELLSIFCY